MVRSNKMEKKAARAAAGVDGKYTRSLREMRDARVDELDLNPVDWIKAGLGNAGPWDPYQTWNANSQDEFLAASVGVQHDPESGSEPVMLHLGSSQSPVVGSHVSIWGKPGSGKTEGMCSIALSLALRYSPQRVNIVVLTPFASEYSKVAQLPHVVGVLEVNADSEDWAAKVLEIEGDRRGAVLDAAGEVDWKSYRASLEPDADAPELIVLCDGWDSMGSWRSAPIRTVLGRFSGEAARRGIRVIVSDQFRTEAIGLMARPGTGGLEYETSTQTGNSVTILADVEDLFSKIEVDPCFVERSLADRIVQQMAGVGAAVALESRSWECCLSHTIPKMIDALLVDEASADAVRALVKQATLAAHVNAAQVLPPDIVVDAPAGVSVRDVAAILSMVLMQAPGLTRRTVSVCDSGTSPAEARVAAVRVWPVGVAGIHGHPPAWAPVLRLQSYLGEEAMGEVVSGLESRGLTLGDEERELLTARLGVVDVELVMELGIGQLVTVIANAAWGRIAVAGDEPLAVAEVDIDSAVRIALEHGGEVDAAAASMTPAQAL